MFVPRWPIPLSHNPCDGKPLCRLPLLWGSDTLSATSERVHKQWCLNLVESTANSPIYSTRTVLLLLLLRFTVTQFISCMFGTSAEYFKRPIPSITVPICMCHSWQLSCINTPLLHRELWLSMIVTICMCTSCWLSCVNTPISEGCDCHCDREQMVP